MQQEVQSVKLDTYYTIIKLARKHRAESLCQMAEDLYKQAVAISRALAEPKPTLLAEALYESASYYEFQGKDNQAEPLWKELLSYEEYFASNYHVYVQTVFSFAQLNERKGNIDTTENLYKNLLQKQEQELGDESLEICPTLDNLASFYCRQNKYPLAEALHLRILVIKEFYLGTCSPEINYTVDALIVIFKKLSKWRLAEYMMNRQKGILLALHGKDSLCVASCALRLAELQTSTNQINRAIENLSFAIQVYTSKFGGLTNPVIALQNKLDTLLIRNVEINCQPFENSIDSNEINTAINETDTVNIEVPGTVSSAMVPA